MLVIIVNRIRMKINFPHFLGHMKEPGVIMHRTGNHSSFNTGVLVPPPQRGNGGTSSCPSELYRELSPSSHQSHCPDGIKPSQQHTYCQFQGSGSTLTNRQEHRLTMPATSQDTGPRNNRQNPLPTSLLSLLYHHPSTK